MNRFQLVFASALVAAMPFVGGPSGAAASTLNRVPQAPPAPAAPPATGIVIYDSLPVPQTPNVPSLGYEATSTSEFGDHVAFAGTSRTVTKVTVLMSAWGKQSEYPSMTDPTGWMHPISLNLYNVVPGATPTVGSLIATKTQNFKIPWRPEPDVTCPSATQWRSDSDGQCYNGYAFNIVFDLTSLNVTLPNEIIYGLAYNTADYGAVPIHIPGPYNSLNFGLAGAAPSAGTDVNLDDVFWNTSIAGFYTDGGASGVGIFRQDTNWTGYVPTIRFETSVKATKAEIRASLAGMLPTGDKKADEAINKALDHLDKSLAPSLWADGSHLTDKGKKVFDEEKKAVEELMKVKGPLAATLGPAITGLAAVDKQLAQTAINEVNCGANAKCQQELAKANASMVKAAADIAKGDYDKAINDYKEAWDHAMKAADKVVVDVE